MEGKKHKMYLHVQKKKNAQKKNGDSKKWLGLSAYILAWTKSSHCRKVTEWRGGDGLVAKPCPTIATWWM